MRAAAPARASGLGEAVRGAETGSRDFRRDSSLSASRLSCASPARGQEGNASTWKLDSAQPAGLLKGTRRRTHKQKPAGGERRGKSAEASMGERHSAGQSNSCIAGLFV